MTAQVQDTIHWRGEEWHLAGIAGDGLFDPTSVGLQPTMLSTANWRGFQCIYTVEDDRLVLASLTIGLSNEAFEAAPPDGPTIDGRPASRRVGIASTWDDLRLPVAFSGLLTLGRGFIRELYVHMGHQPAWKYESVVELTFLDGRLEGAEDATARHAEMRRRLGGTLRPEPGGPIERLRAWIARTFDRSDPERSPLTDERDRPDDA